MSIVKTQTSLVPVPPSFSIQFVTVSTDKDGKQKQKFTKGLISYQTLFGGDNLYSFKAVLSYGTKVIDLYTFVINKLGKIEAKPNHNSIFKDNAFPLGEYESCLSGYEFFITSLGLVDNLSVSDLGYQVYTGLLDYLDIDTKTGQISGYSPKVLKQVCTDLLPSVTLDNLPLYVFVSANQLPPAIETDTQDQDQTA